MDISKGKRTVWIQAGAREKVLSEAKRCLWINNDLAYVWLYTYM